MFATKKMKTVKIINFLLVICLAFMHNKASLFLCGDGNRTNITMINVTKLCNGFNDCEDFFASDECNCTAAVTNVCLNGKCILEYNICDGKDDCNDGYASDEKNCIGKISTNFRLFSNESTTFCNLSSSAWCADEKTCILQASFCNGIYDCPDLSDEHVIGAGFKCIVNSSLASYCVLPQSNLYDDSATCMQNRDVCFDSNGNLTAECFFCMDGNHIISKHQVCDGVMDCLDFSDECLCKEIKTIEFCKAFQSNQSKAEESKDEACTTSFLLCNHFEDCSDGLDEKYCYPQRNYSSTSFTAYKTSVATKVQSSNTTMSCMNKEHGWIIAGICDGVPHCDNLEDECNLRCGNLSLFCNVNISCLAVHQICDGVWNSDVHCQNGRIEEEESGCNNRFYCGSDNISSIRLDQVKPSNCLNGINVE